MKTFRNVLMPLCCSRRERRSIFRISTKKGRNDRDRLVDKLGKLFKLKTDAREMMCLTTNDPLIFATRCALHTVLAPFSICTLTKWDFSFMINMRNISQSGSLLTATQDHDASIDLESTSIKNQLSIKIDEVVELIKQNYANHEWCLVRKIGRRQDDCDRQSETYNHPYCSDNIQRLNQSPILDFTSSCIGYVPLNKLQPTVHWHNSSSNKRFELLISMPNGTRRSSGKSISLTSSDSKDEGKDSSTKQQRKPIETISRTYISRHAHGHDGSRDQSNFSARDMQSIIFNVSFSWRGEIGDGRRALLVCSCLDDRLCRYMSICHSCDA
uniref:Uncharacterized protein n=1 Tax=Romanomermis culicivorax TaxID=13658 RepID=A0A915I190_ROMCU